MNQKELQKILENHKLWLDSNGKQGNRANLREANLREADLEGADLSWAILDGADLTGTILENKKKKTVSSVSPSFDEELGKLLDKHGMKLVGNTILSK